MESRAKVYQAIISTADLTRAGLRVSVLAENLAEAKKKLEEEHGSGTVFNLHCQEDAEKPR